MLQTLVAEKVSIERGSLLVQSMHSNTQMHHSAVSYTDNILDNRGRTPLFGADKARMLAFFHYAE